jgi:hypothetical protein
MAPRYHLANDLEQGDLLQSTSPHWVLGFARYLNPVTYDPSQRKSVNDDASYAYSERTDPLVVGSLRGGCTSLTVSASKSDHVMTMNAEFQGGDVEYLNEVLPGDWVAACMLYDETEALAVEQKMLDGKAVNYWGYGLKFVGKVQSVRQIVRVDPSGTPWFVYVVQATAFSEFDSVVMYYPQLQHSDSIPVSLDKFGLKVSAIIRGQDSNAVGGIDINKVVPELMTTIFAQGAWAKEKFLDDAMSPNVAYIVPTTICKWLGIPSTNGTFSDLMHILMGVQKFNNVASATDKTVPNPGKLFWPDGVTNSTGAYRGTYELVGSFPMNVVPQTTSTPWSFISNYINEPINERTVTLRADENGYIFPFFTIRQTPFTSEVGRAFKPEDFDLTNKLSATPQKQDPASSWKGTPYAHSVFDQQPTTRFLELPRWVVAAQLVKMADIGRSDQIRQNLVYIYGSGPGVPFNEYQQFILSKPIKDELDILRNGVRPYWSSVRCYLQDQKNPTDWRDLMADVVMGQHLTLNGTLAISGIRAPVVPGDNVEYGNVVYHIEALTHSCSISADGQRQFTTTLSLSRGVADVGSSTQRSDTYAAIRAGDSIGTLPGSTKD